MTSRFLISAVGWVMVPCTEIRNNGRVFGPGKVLGPRENEFSNFFSSKHRKLELTKKSIFEINLAFFLSRNSSFNIRIYIFLILGKC